MSTIACPRCDSPEGRPLDATSHVAPANYYHCERCALVWKRPKRGGYPIEVVAPQMNAEKAASGRER